MYIPSFFIFCIEASSFIRLRFLFNLNSGSLENVNENNYKKQNVFLITHVERIKIRVYNYRLSKNILVVWRIQIFLSRPLFLPQVLVSYSEIRIFLSAYFSSRKTSSARRVSPSQRRAIGRLVNSQRHCFLGNDTRLVRLVITT